MAIYKTGHNLPLKHQNHSYFQKLVITSHYQFNKLSKNQNKDQQDTISLYLQQELQSSQKPVQKYF